MSISWPFVIIVKLGDDTLRKVCKPQETSSTCACGPCSRTWPTPCTRPTGVGLAGPQVGILRRVVVIDVGDGLVELINPEIIAQEGSQCGREGCLSLPGRQGTWLPGP